MQDCMVEPDAPAQGSPSAQLGAGGQVVVPPPVPLPVAEPPQERAAPTVVQTGAPGAKQQEPL